MTALDFGESGINRVEIYDNSADLADEKDLRRIMSMRQGRVTALAGDVPGWLDQLLKGTKFEIAAHPTGTSFIHPIEIGACCSCLYRFPCPVSSFRCALSP